MRIPIFLLLSGLTAFALCGIAWLLRTEPQVSESWLPISIAVALMWMATSVAYTFSYLGLEKNARTFMTLFFSGMILKFFLGVISVIIVALRYKPFLNGYVLGFFVSYFVFATFEVFGLINKLRAISRKV